GPLVARFTVRTSRPAGDGRVAVTTGPVVRRPAGAALAGIPVALLAAACRRASGIVGRSVLSFVHVPAIVADPRRRGHLASVPPAPPLRAASCRLLFRRDGSSCRLERRDGSSCR